MKQKVIYYNEQGKIDKFATFINNNEWTLLVMVIIILAVGFVEGM